ncbi:MAG: RNA-binding protein [Lysobacteraceae bacterium]|nr:MAG: RNA-binding protein [Xanthomonadaceae bacterium]
MIAEQATVLFLATIASAPGSVSFAEVASTYGIEFTHDNGARGEVHFTETVGSGVVWFDYDADGHLDLLLINSGTHPHQVADSKANAQSKLFRNNGDSFRDVTEEVGLENVGYGLGGCAADIDANGYTDLVITTFGENRLYMNVNGRLQDASDRLQDGPKFSTGCAFGDVDGDRDLDLYIVSYVDYDYQNRPFCGELPSGEPNQCVPTQFVGSRDNLLINNDGYFVEESAARGLDAGRNDRGFGVLMIDLDGDVDLDIYVANDGSANRLYRNDGRGFFSDDSLLSGAAYDQSGQPQAGMGVAAGDLWGSPLPELVVTNFAMEHNNVYTNHGAYFADDARQAGLLTPSFREVSWGVVLFDADNDADLDMVVVNGHVVPDVELIEPLMQYGQPNQFFSNHASKFSKQDAGFSGQHVSRGLAAADFDNNGTIDLAIINQNGPAELWQNTTQHGEIRWAGLTLEGLPPNTDAIGAKIQFNYSERLHTRFRTAGDSFLSQSDPRFLVPVAPHSDKAQVTINWPDGSKSTAEIPVSRYTVVAQPDSGK